MLPGFRFLFAAVVLSMSILIFGLGAAALLRAAHDQFASIPTRRILPEPVFAQQPAFTQPSETPAATLAMLRVEPPVVEKAPDTPAVVIAAPVEPAPEAVPVPPVESEKLAALKVDDSATTEPAKPEIAAKPAKPETSAKAEPAPATEAAPVQTVTLAPADEVKVAAVEQAAPAGEQAAPSVATAAAPVVPEPAIVPPAPKRIGATTKIATLGGPAVTVEAPATAKPKSAEADRDAIRKRQRAQRAKERRRLAAQRARLAAQQAGATQQQSDPFAPQPTITTATTARRR